MPTPDDYIFGRIAVVLRLSGHVDGEGVLGLQQICERANIYLSNEALRGYLKEAKAQFDPDYPPIDFEQVLFRK